MTDKQIIMTGKEQIKCKYMFQDKEKFDGKPYCVCFNELCEDLSFVCDDNCQIYEDYKQLTRKTTECRKYEHLFNELDKRVSNSTKIFDCIVVSKIIKDIINKAKGAENKRGI